MRIEAKPFYTPRPSDGIPPEWLPYVVNELGSSFDFLLMVYPIRTEEGTIQPTPGLGGVLYWDHAHPNGFAFSNVLDAQYEENILAGDLIKRILAAPSRAEVEQ